MMNCPVEVRQQYLELINSDSNLDRAECEARFPALITFVRESVDIVDLMADYGIHLKPLSEDCPDILIAEAACPICGDGIFVKAGRP